MRIVHRLLTLAGFVVCATAAFADDVQFIGSTSIPGDAVDKSGLTDTLAGGFPHNRLGCFGSGICYSGRDHRYLTLPDRGPADGATTFHCRVQVFDITVDPTAPAGQRVKADFQNTIMLTTESGQPLVGDQTAVGKGNGDVLNAVRFDSEGIAVAADGTFFVSDEYGPCVDHFTADGKRLKRMLPPAKFINPVSSGEPAQEMPPHSTTGRQSNRGMEGLTLLPGGQQLVGVMQSPLLQDGALDDAGKRAGLNIRMVEMPGDGVGTTREWVYRLDAGGNGVSELLAINDHEFLVLERDSTSGKAAKFRRVFRVDVAHATDVSGVQRLPKGELPAEIVPVTKKLLLDFVDPKFNLGGADGSGMPEKIEGMTWGPPLADGRRLLIVTSDNDYSDKNPSWIWAFAVKLD
jgi:hypothetical protein